MKNCRPEYIDHIVIIYTSARRAHLKLDKKQKNEVDKKERWYEAGKDEYE
jgi:hypothetical protein